MASIQLTPDIAEVITGNTVASSKAGIPDQCYPFEDYIITLEFLPWQGLFILSIICDRPIGAGDISFIRRCFDVPDTATETTVTPRNTDYHIIIIAWLVPELAEVVNMETLLSL